MAYALITHEVEDYARWRAVFDESEGIRESAGLGATRVYQDVDNPNVVTVMVHGELGKLQTFDQMPELREAMAKAGVKGNPHAMFLDDVT